jgi:para-aminobenzoate synthetase component 1
MHQAAIIACDWAEPVEVLAACAEAPFALGLMSDGSGGQARWSYVARDPLATLTLSPQNPSEPLAAMRGMLGPRLAALPDGPPFQGGLIGLACYEFGARLEPLALERMAGWPDLACGLYPALLAFDHRDRRVLAIGRGEGQGEAQGRAQSAAAWLSGARRPAAPEPLVEGLSVEAGAAYASAVAEVVERIGAGEIFQANIARAWRGRLRRGAEPIDLMRRLIGQSPAPFAAYLRLADRAVVSNSPERFVQVRPSAEGFIAQTRPIKGTRPRGWDGAEDARLIAELLASAKDRAENLMIVDLMRNDLARVCERVETRELFRCESFANVHHLVSTVEGRLKAGLSGLDAFMAAFPPGSVTGAPKIQAMKVIAGLEPPRGPYCGSLFWAGFDGALDSSVLIRTAVFEEGQSGWRIEARAGAGIVADSDPAAEVAETEAKIAALARALGEGAPA